MSPQAASFADVLASFHPRARTLLAAVPRTGGRLSVKHARQLGDLLGTDLDGVAQRLVPVAAAFSRSPVSGFRVGAVLQAAPGQEPALALGANMEFPGADIRHTLHAEQVAVANAWLAGVTCFASIAVSAAPCGHCRQFLNEVQGADQPLRVMTPRAGGHERYHQRPLAELLPEAFGPEDLGIANGLNHTVSTVASPGQGDALPPDPAVQAAAAAAAQAYVPYGGNRAGCTIVTVDGSRFTGRSMENAAYNPGITAFQTALASLYMTSPDAASVPIEQVVLVEDATAFTQRASTMELLKTIAPAAAFDYYPLT